MRLSRTQQCARLVQGRRSRVCDKTLYGWGVNLHHVHELDRRRPSELACLHVDSEGGDSITPGVAVGDGFTSQPGQGCQERHQLW